MEEEAQLLSKLEMERWSPHLNTVEQQGDKGDRDGVREVCVPPLSTKASPRTTSLSQSSENIQEVTHHGADLGRAIPAINNRCL